MPTKTLAVKLVEIRKAITAIDKKGHNKHGDYDYVKAEDVLREIRKQLDEHKIILQPQSGMFQHDTIPSGKQLLTTVELIYTLVDCESNESIESKWLATGADTGDKGLYKAYTGGLKYFLLNLFLIPTGDDPEADQGVHPDDARPAAPLIPADRAVHILEQARQAKLASEGDKPQYKPVFKAKLLSVGVTSAKIGDINVDQAEDIEAFLTEEVKNK
jgi:ERF superfamily